MTMKDFFLAQLEREAASTRRTVERVPDEDPEWRPHPKSMALGYLATLVATLPGWVALTINKDFHEPTPKGGPNLATTAERLEAFEKSMEEARAALKGTTDDHLLKNWQLKVGGQVVYEALRHMVITDSVLSHLAHHRGQLTVYLRLLEKPVPSIYGPSADEGLFPSK